MNIVVVGLGLIGGSFCKAISHYTDHTCLGMDTDSKTIQAALQEGAIEQEATVEDLQKADLTLICLHPEPTIRFILDHLNDFREGGLVSDVCGVKQTIEDAVAAPLRACGVHYIGTHPMAGREFSGYFYAKENLFQHASFIITRQDGSAPPQEEILEQLARDLGFRKIVYTTAKIHDQIIAYTSQLAHLVSSAYIKSPTLHQRVGFSAGSFLDLTRVAQLNEEMWTSLFLMNRDALLFEVDEMLRHLEEYKNALEQSDAQTLKALLKQGRLLKEESIKDAQQGGNLS